MVNKAVPYKIRDAALDVNQSGLGCHLLQGFEYADDFGSSVDEFSKALLGCMQHLGADG